MVTVNILRDLSGEAHEKDLWQQLLARAFQSLDVGLVFRVLFVSAAIVSGTSGVSPFKKPQMDHHHRLRQMGRYFSAMERLPGN